MSALLPRPLGDAELAFPAVHRACADAGVPLRDRYGWAIPADWIRRAVNAARSGTGTKEGAVALSEEMFNGLELCPDRYEVPATVGQLLLIVQILRSPVADVVVRPVVGEVEP